VIVSVLPLRIVGCDGSPVRAVAWLQSRNQGGSLFVTCGFFLTFVCNAFTKHFVQRWGDDSTPKQWRKSGLEGRSSAARTYNGHSFENVLIFLVGIMSALRKLHLSLDTACHLAFTCFSLLCLVLWVTEAYQFDAHNSASSRSRYSTFCPPNKMHGKLIVVIKS
jgi:hypothetical protein